MICARKQADLREDLDQFEASSPSRPGECETLATKVRHSPQKNSKNRRKRNRAAKAKTKRKPTAIERHERAVVQELRKKVRSVRDAFPANPRIKEPHPSASEAFTPEVRHAVSPANEATDAGFESIATDDLTPRLLHDKQSLALTALLQGQTVVDAAKAAGVNRRTVHRWLQQAEFQAELHRLQSCLCTSLRMTAGDLLDESVQVIQEALERGGLNTALDLLKAVKVLNGQPLTTIDGLNAEPDPAMVFPAPQPAAELSPAVKVDETIKPLHQPITTATLTPDDLPPKQHLAIVALISGKVVPDAAKLAGVSISTLQRWMQSDTDFRQVLIASRQEQQRQLRTKLLNLGVRSLDILRLALKKYRNVRVAFAVLRGVGVLSSQK